MPNLELAGPARLSIFRRLALGTWRTPSEASIYGSMRLRMDATMRYIEDFRRATGKRLTVTHLMAKVVADVLDEVPAINAILRFGRIYRRKDIAVFFQVAIEDPQTKKLDLSGVTIRDPQKKSLVQIVDEFEGRTGKVRAGRDEEFGQSRGMFSRLPVFLVGFVLRMVSFINYTLNLDLRWAGVPRNAFGSAMVTNIGSLGLEGAYAPLVPYTRVPLLIAMGAVDDEAVVVDGEIVTAKTMRLYATFDHRLIDGAHAAKMVQIVRRHFESPDEHFGAIDDTPSAELAAAAPANDADAAR